MATTRRIRQGALLALLLTVGMAAAAPIEEETIAAVRQVWQDQHKAFDSHDLDGVMATFADSDDIMVMGTGPGEHYIGKGEIREAYSQFMQGFDPRTMETECQDGHGSRQGDVLWLTAVCDFSDRKGEAERRYSVNLSAVLVKADDAWRFHSMHFSHLTAAAKDAGE